MQEFRATNKKFTFGLCIKDSDGDGRKNWWELGLVASEIKVNLFHNMTKETLTLKSHPCMYLNPKRKKRVEMMMQNWMDRATRPFESFEVVSITSQKHRRRRARGHPGMYAIWVMDKPL